MLKNSLNLFGTKFMELFKMWDTSISVRYENVVGMVKSLNEVEQLRRSNKKITSKCFFWEG